MGLYEGVRLLAFVVASTSGGQKAAAPLPSPAQLHVEKSPPAPAQHQDDLRSPVRLQQQQASGADGDLSRQVVDQLSVLLPSHSVPDTLLLVPALCLTPHGEQQDAGHSRETTAAHSFSIVGILMLFLFPQAK